jgi:hypothetical protein
MSGYQRQNRGGDNRQKEYPKPDIEALVFLGGDGKKDKAPELTGIITFNEDFTFRRGDTLQLSCWDRRKRAKNGSDIFGGECAEGDGGRQQGRGRDDRRRDHDRDRNARSPSSNSCARGKAGDDDRRPRDERDDPRDYDRGRRDSEAEYDEDGLERR